MPASPALVRPAPAPIAVPPALVAPVRLVRSSAVCPVCGNSRCIDPAACNAEYEAREWATCPDCEGTGFDSTEFQIWCSLCGGAKVVELDAVTPGELSDVEWIAALYASDYVTKARPQVDEIADLIAQGLAHVGHEGVAEMTRELIAFWDHCEADTATREVWAQYTARFDNIRMMQASYVIERAVTALHRHFNPAPAGVAA
ncbi:hypothetical protein ACWGCC_23055 [Streptomyces nigrescens]